MSGALASNARPLGRAFDLLAAYQEGGTYFERAGIGLAAAGEAARLEAAPGPERIFRLSRMVADALGSIARHPESPPPVAVSSIAFEDDRPAVAVIPSRTAIRLEASETWQLEVATGAPPAPRGGRERWAGRTLPHGAFADIQLRPDPEPDEYAEAVRRALAKIARG